MKKNFTLFGMLALSMFANAQMPTRLSLYEEFTGENCGPCAQTNPGLNALLASQASKIIAIKWQVPIPSAPTNTWSLYQTNITEIDWRYQAGGYGYQSQNSQTNTPSAGINSAPQGRIDGQHQWVFGASQDHPAVLTSAVIGSAQAVPTPFSINMTAAWNASFTSAVVSVTVQAAANFTANGNLVFRNVLVERTINFPTPPGSNGEKDFYDAARKSYPTLQSGTALSNTWTAGQTQTFTMTCASPAYIVNLYQQAFVGFIQDDGNKMVYQAFRTSKPAVPNDIEVTSVNAGLNCTQNFTPSINVVNNGTTSITSFTATPYIDGVAQTTYTWSGSLAGLASSLIPLSGYTANVGSHTFSLNITNVSGGDLITTNNNNYSVFGVVGTFTNTSVTEPFTNASFPPANWMIQNFAAQTATTTWVRSSTVGNGNPVGSAAYDFYDNGFYTDIDDMVLPPANFSGMNNPILQFDWAYSSYPTGVGNEVYQDGLAVLVSTNCGTSWTSVWAKTGATLQTAPSTTAAFVPSVNQWSTASVPLAMAANQSQVLVKFRAINDYGNFLYVDNVNLSQAASVKQNQESVMLFELYPNPASSSATLKTFSTIDQKAKVIIYNNLGQMVKMIEGNLSFGTNETIIDLSQMPSGIYHVALQTDSGSQIKKLSVNK